MYTEFGKQVHIELVKRGMTITELANKVNEKYGTKHDCDYLSRLLIGKTTSLPCCKRMAAVLGLEEPNAEITKAT